jgi:hypothetical protein
LAIESPVALKSGSAKYFLQSAHVGLGHIGNALLDYKWQRDPTVALADNDMNAVAPE